MNLKFDILDSEFLPKVEYDDMILLFDTGASTPVWCQGIGSFLEFFPKAKKMNYRYILTGFGRSEAELIAFLKNPNEEGIASYLVDVYSIPEFIMETEDEKIVWNNLNVAVTSRRFSAVHMILPYTMFGGMKLSFNQACANPEIIIESPKAIKYTFVKLNNNFNESVLQYIYSQDEPEQHLTKTMSAF